MSSENTALQVNTEILSENNTAETSIFSRRNREPVFRRRNKPRNDEIDETINNTQTAAHLRIQRDLADLNLQEYQNVKIIRNEDEWMEFSLVIYPTTGYWKEGMYEFKFNIPPKYPFDGPKVICIDKIYHPNIDVEGKICVNILRPWKPTYSVEHVLFALLFLFTTPNANDPLNNEAAAEMRNDSKAFEKNVIKAMKGGRVGTVTFPKNRGNVEVLNIND